MRFTLNKTKVLRILFIIIGILLLFNILTVYLRFNTAGMEARLTRLLIMTFDFNLEANVPTFFSALLLLSNGILLYFIAGGYREDRWKFWKWMGLSFIFIFLSMDEMLKIHEQFRGPFEKLLNTTGIFYYAWFIPYIIVMAIIGLIYFKFMMRLPKRILKLFILAGVLFISGAVVLEAISGMYDEQYGHKTMAYHIMYTIEEFLEMSGSAVFHYALIYYMSINFKSLMVTFSAKEENIEIQ